MEGLRRGGGEEHLYREENMQLNVNQYAALYFVDCEEHVPKMQSIYLDDGALQLQSQTFIYRNRNY
jgi:hypothetical protein